MHPSPPFACPACHAPLAPVARGLTCTACAAAYPRDGDLVDFAPQLPRQGGLSQRLMESPLVAPIYEKAFRPLFTRLGSTIRYHEEEAYLRRWQSPVPGLPVLDLACGTGHYARLLAQLTGGGAVLGLDLSWSMLRRAPREGQAPAGAAITYARASAQALPLASLTLGAVNCFGALHLFPDPAGALREVGRVLSPGGTFTCLTARQEPGGLRRRAQETFARAWRFTFFSEQALARMMENAGLQVLDLRAQQVVLLAAARRRGRQAG